MATGDTLQDWKVLVVDDSEFFANMISREIDERSTLRTTACHSAQEAQDIIESDDSVGCVISDYEMSPMNGLDLLETIREDHKTLPFMLLTGQGNEDVASEAIRLGATDYITKETVVEDGDFRFS